MLSSDASPLRRIIKFSRWVIPVTLSVLGFGYTLWESVLYDRYPLTSHQVLAGFTLIGVAGPLLVFLTLNWAERVTAALERAEQARERQRRHLIALNQIGEAVNQSLDLNTVLNRAMENVLEVMHLESGDVRLVENDRLVMGASHGVSPVFIQAEQIIPLGQCVCGACAQRGALIAIEDLNRSPEFARTNCACENFRAMLSVPVRTAEHIVGVIHVTSREPRVFDAADRELLSTIGNQVGAAIEKARLHAQLMALNQELEARVAERTDQLTAAKQELTRKADALEQVLIEELRVEEKTRASIAHDLHDGVQQLIVGALFETQAARDALVPKPETAQEHISAAQELLQRIGLEMRHAIYSLRPLALDTHGLVPALREGVASFERVARVKCDLQVEGTPRRLNPEAEVVAFRISQEALNNVEAHARASQVQVCVHFDTREVSVEIADDGQGFDVASVAQEAHTQLGLIGMRERAESVGGKLDVCSRIGEGTRVVLTLPMSRAV